MDKYKEVFSKYFDETAFNRALNFKPRSTDIIISTFQKSGTTWSQQICHGLRSNGDMDFEEIDMVVPSLEFPFPYNEDLEAEQKFNPRMFKTHLSPPQLPRGAHKYVVCVREPTSVAISYYHHLSNWFFEEGAMTADEFVQNIYLQQGAPNKSSRYGSHMHHIMNWYPHRLDDNVLWLHYEDLRQDLATCVKMVSDFLDIGVGDEERLKKATHQASFEFMKEHWKQFYGGELRVHRSKAMGTDTYAPAHKHPGRIRNGKINEGKEVLSAEILAKIDQRWKEIVTSQTGYETYEDMREGINKELGRNFA